jgi:hypothetical protein
MKEGMTWQHQADRVIDQAAKRISDALDHMECKLPEEAAAQNALEEVVRQLAKRQPWFMRLLMEDYDIRETYYASVAERPVAASPEPRRYNATRRR